MSLALDKEGFLRHLSDWDKGVADQLADNAGIKLTEAHWEVIGLTRDYYQKHNIFPVNRVLIQRMREELGEDKGSSIYLMQLFTGKPRRFVAMISGLPKPTNCD
ncbi:MAG: TusE/DsrC/DsvC family sulfur relay protein [Gammaproteobacteria bacterium]|jgi:tRNA 2-thiouridine synthesizing protein E|nr:TusE/DsrC/DsvC family sulfur relay protein [Gammaproteobacteria bacterium]MBT7370778.1 TusE/DsrC/DsvC family sulfur relay protein [Gammaproteobacteria bacterium]